MKKTKVKLVGKDGNVFNLVAIASSALKKDKKYTEAEEMTTRVFNCGSYNKALSIIMEYCKVN